MPIYEFECAACSNRFDRLQKLSDPDPSACPACGAERVSRRLTAPAFRLSGSGWYETDFKKDGDKKRNLVDKAEAPKSAAESAPKSDAAKPAAAPAAVPAKPKGDSAPVNKS
ncbi:MAG: zinc ribbon domain-containing protein [Proteobacteria bacterium]|uniref:FmdB family zinc ribbon protein n=1 Tax=Rudaea sp. TaxID=2136325 RepID=UPI00321F60FE|nr:zinc ribbon domain-containing protein [Pseudomonadota bacterium]